MAGVATDDSPEREDLEPFYIIPVPAEELER